MAAAHPPSIRSVGLALVPGVTSALVVPPRRLYDQLRSPALRKKWVGKGIPRSFTGL